MRIQRRWHSSYKKRFELTTRVKLGRGNFHHAYSDHHPIYVTNPEKFRVCKTLEELSARIERLEKENDRLGGLLDRLIKMMRQMTDWSQKINKHLGLKWAPPERIQ